MPPAGTLNLIAAAGTVEPEPVVGQAQGVPQMLGLGHFRPETGRRGTSQVLPMLSLRGHGRTARG